MAYYKMGQRQDEEEPIGAPGLPPPAQGPIPKTPGQSPDLGSAQPQAAKIPASQAGPPGTRSKQNFVNIQRYLDANPMGKYAENVGVVGKQIGAGIQKDFDTQAIPSSVFFQTPEYQKWGQERAQTPILTPQGGVAQGAPDMLWNLVKKAADGDKIAESQVKSLLQSNPEMFPKDMNWALGEEAKQRIESFKNPGQTGRFGMARTMAGKEPGYSAGMEGLDAALFGSSKEVQQAANEAKQGLESQKAELEKVQKEKNEQLKGLRDYETKSAEETKKFLAGKYDEGLKRLFPYSGPRDPWPSYMGPEPKQPKSDINYFRKVAELLGEDPNKFQEAQYVKPDFGFGVNPPSIRKQEEEQAKREAKQPEAMKRKLAQIEDSIKRSNRRDDVATAGEMLSGANAIPRGGNKNYLIPDDWASNVWFKTFGRRGL